MNNLLLILGILALSNGNMSLFGSKNKLDNNLKIDKKESKSMVSKKKIKKVRKQKISNDSNTKKVRKIKKISKNPKKSKHLSYDMNDVKNGIKLMDLSEEDLDRGMEIITRTKKYMSPEERKMLIKIESILDLVKGIKKLNEVDILGEEEESEFFRTMEQEDKKNMMIKEIIEVFPEKRKESLEKAIDIKKKIDLLAELFLPDSDEEGGFSLASLIDIGNLGSIDNLKLLGSLLRGDNLDSDDECDKQYLEDSCSYNEPYYYYEAIEDNNNFNNKVNTE